jgi:hypothetical protein
MLLLVPLGSRTGGWATSPIPLSWAILHGIRACMFVKKQVNLNSLVELIIQGVVNPDC